MEYLFPNNTSFPLGCPWVTVPAPAWASPGLSSPPARRGSSAFSSSHSPGGQEVFGDEGLAKYPVSHVPVTLLRAEGNLGAWSPRCSR